MRNIRKNNSGITLIALTVTIIVMIILATIGINSGKEIIKKSKIQTLQTNMLTIQAKAKAYAEEIEAKVWLLSGEKRTKKITDEFSEKGMEGPTEEDGKLKFTFNTDGLSKMELNELKTEEYYVLYDQNYQEIDIVYQPGIEYKGNKYYKLSELQNLINEE